MKKYNMGDIVSATITKVEPYGAFVRIDDEYIGLIHISEINGYYIKNIDRYFSRGKKVVCRITNVNSEKKHLSLSMIDIDVRTNYNQINNLKETKIGFSELQKKLPKWIKAKEIEIENSKIKKK